MIQFAIIGYGYMGHVHADSLSKLEDAQLAAVCDREPSMMDDAPEGVLRYQDAKELYKNPDIDVVIISANNNQHKELVCMAAGAGKDIICEKPVALCVSDLDEMLAAVEKNGVRFTVHQQRRYDKDFRTVKDIYEGGSLGNVYTIQTGLYGYNGNMHDWHVKKEEGGGMLYDWGVHLLDQMLWMVDSKVISVFADLRNVINEEVDDYFNITLQFENGIMAQLELGTYYLTDKPGWFSRHWFVGGDKGSLYTDGMNPKGKIVRTEHLLTNTPGKRTMTAFGPTRSFGPPPEGLILTEDIQVSEAEQLDYFHDFIKAYQQGYPFLVRAEEVRRVLALMETIRQSAREKRSIAFEGQEA